MTEKEIAEIRRRFRGEKQNISGLTGCYVNEKKALGEPFYQSLEGLPEEETEKLMGLFRKGLSGGVGRNLFDITFTTAQVVDSEEHRLLMGLRNSRLKDEALLTQLYEKIASSLALEGSYLILLAEDRYDLPTKTKDGIQLQDGSEEVFSYLICCICPVKLPKEELSYLVMKSSFRSIQGENIVSSPVVGFMFPAFDDRSSNIYGALYYSKDVKENHPTLVEALFQSQLPMAPEQQKETLSTILAETLGEQCNYNVVQGLHEGICEMIAEHKGEKDEQPLTVNKNQLKTLLHQCGVEEQDLVSFDQQYTESFGEHTALCPKNLVDQRQVTVKTPDIVIKVSSEGGRRLETKVIDGKKYILIQVDESVEVNGVAIHFDEKEPCTL